jgi:hypothetical protein
MWLGVVGALAGAATLLAGMPSADATTWVKQGTHDMRGFISAPTPTFACRNGYTGVYPIQIKSASNYNLKVYETVYWWLWTNSGWQRWTPGNSSPQPGGIYVGRNSSPVKINGHSWPSGHGYWYMETRLDFANADVAGPFLGTVYIEANQASDYYYGGVASYCQA